MSRRADLTNEDSGVTDESGCRSLNCTQWLKVSRTCTRLKTEGVGRAVSLVGLTHQGHRRVINACGPIRRFSGVHTKRVTDLHESLRLSRHREVAAAQLLGVQLAADSPAGTFAATAHTLREKADQGTRRDRDADHSPAAWAPPALYREVGATAARLQRQHAVAVGYQAARFGESRHASTMPRRAYQERMAAIQAALRPPGAPPKAHVGGLYMAGVLTPQHFGDCAFATPMSAIGAGGCAILSYCNASIPRLLSVFRIRMGRVCLAHWPFAPPRAQGGAQGDQNQSVKARIKAMSAPGPCEACDCDGAPVRVETCTTS